MRGTPIFTCVMVVMASEFFSVYMTDFFVCVVFPLSFSEAAFILFHS